MNAFVLSHFGNNPKFLELEIYLCINLRKNTKYDIIYMYSINDTPDEFVNVMKEYCNHTIPIDDTNITYDVKFSSPFPRFNILRTCNFIFAYKLLQYKKICLLESDMVITGNIDDIFNLKTPSILIYNDNILENSKIDIIKNNIQNINTNGGIMLIKPSLSKYKQYLKNIKYIIEKEYVFPNESLFLYTNKYVYNLPYKYNSHANQEELIDISKKYNINMKEYPLILHFKCKSYKQIDIIKDKYLEDMKNKKYLIYYFLSIYKKEYYDKYHKKIEKIIKSLTK
jgi:hypothetical protein